MYSTHLSPDFAAVPTNRTPLAAPHHVLEPSACLFLIRDSLFARDYCCSWKDEFFEKSCDEQHSPILF